jgi:hypothetical protein
MNISMNEKPTVWNTGHWPTLIDAFFYFDFSFMVWTGTRKSNARMDHRPSNPEIRGRGDGPGHGFELGFEEIREAELGGGEHACPLHRGLRLNGAPAPGFRLRSVSQLGNIGKSAIREGTC